jgi:signal transduction histidine kinase
MLSQKLDNLQGDKSKVNDYLDLLQKNSDRLDGFVKNLLNIAKIDEGDISVKKMPVDVFRLINKNAAFIKPLLEKKNLTLQVQGRDNLLVNCDEEKIDQVISNLLSNAIKFSDGGKILIQAEEKPNFLLISISDQGRGIPKHLEMQIFNRFFQCDPTQKGSGIGLTIAKAWVEAHGGKIWAESPANTMTGEAANNKAGRDGESLPAGRCGRGTTVRFTLPIVKPSNDLIEGNNTGGSK